MPANKRIPRPRHAQRGATLVVVALSLVILLGISALAVDLVSLYVGRSEAQRAADAGALAGATIFVTTGCTSASGGCVAGGPQEAPARQRAIDVAHRNSVGGKGASVLSGDVTFSYPTPLNPTITVRVARDATHDGPMPTFFMKIFGVLSADISAAATAEAYNPTGGGPAVGTKCLKPWLMPNCDWTRLVPAADPNANSNCQDPTSGQFASYYVNNNSVLNPGVSPTGVVGQLITIKPGSPSQASAPSKFYPLFLPPGSVASQCPACAGGGAGAGAPSGSLYAQNIECCNQNTITCGQTTVEPITGNMVGPTAQGVDCLIHEQNGSGQDTVAFSPGGSYTVAAGSNNPLVAAGIPGFTTGSTILPPSASTSVVTVPLYNGQVLCPGMAGGSCGTVTVNIVGFMQLFVKEETNPQGTVNTYIITIAACGASSGGGGGSTPPPVITGGGSPIPVRLIHQ